MAATLQTIQTLYHSANFCSAGFPGVHPASPSQQSRPIFQNAVQAESESRTSRGVIADISGILLQIVALQSVCPWVASEVTKHKKTAVGHSCLGIRLPFWFCSFSILLKLLLRCWRLLDRVVSVCCCRRLTVLVVLFLGNARVIHHVMGDIAGDFELR